MKLPRNPRKVDRWFNVDAGFERDSRKQLGSNIRTFPARFSGIRGDGRHRWDLSVLKNFALSQRVQLRFRGEACNALNHANFSNLPASPAFGKVSGQNGNPRRRQLSLRLTS